MNIQILTNALLRDETNKYEHIQMHDHRYTNTYSVHPSQKTYNYRIYASQTSLNLIEFIVNLINIYVSN
jgi:hypothetical protein